MKSAERYRPEGQALIWFVCHWFRTRKPYRFVLPQDLANWLNAAELDFSRQVTYHPALGRRVSTSEPKPVSRLMRVAGEQSGRLLPLTDSAQYYDLLAWYAFSFLPESNLPCVLLPQPVISLLNDSADEPSGVLTVGMWLYLKNTHPDELQSLEPGDHERLLALSFCAVEGILSIGDPRLIPETISRFWRRRPQKLITTFEYVASHADSGFDGNTDDEQQVRDWFQQQGVGSLQAGCLMSGPPALANYIHEGPQPASDVAIVVYRDHHTICGLSKAGTSIYDAVVQTGIPVYDLDFSLTRESMGLEFEKNRTLWINARKKLHLLNLNPEHAPDCCYCNLNRIESGDYIIGQFAWEFSTLSKAHEAGIGLVDEIWTGSRFLNELYRAGTGKPVFTMGQVVAAREPTVRLCKHEFGFDDDVYLFLCNFDVQSVVERKNPLGAIIAFQTAFPRGREHTGLVIKTRNLQHFQTERDREHWEEALERIRKDPRIRIIDYTMSEDALAALYRMCDCFVSLHRSEGFGFGPAEAMAHGRPAIVTNYSGVCDFCTTATAKLVPYELIRVQHDQYPYLDLDRVYEWADPDLAVAGECMRELAEDREQSRRLGRAAQALISREFSIAALRSRYLSRLRQLGFIENARVTAVATEC